MSEKHTLTQDERRELALTLNYHEWCANVDIEFSNNTGIGVTIIVRCLDCDKEFNITDYSVW